MNNGKAKIILGLVGFIQAICLAAVIYWTGRVDANTINTHDNRAGIKRIEGQLEQMGKQLDRIEVHVEQGIENHVEHDHD